MIELQSTDFSFNIFPHQKKLRVVVFNNDEEYVCRIESRKKLNQFLGGNDARLFKGRLQLIKIQERITVQVKGRILGELSLEAFRELLNAHSFSKYLNL